MITNEKTVLKFEQVTKSYGKFSVLENISFKLKCGEFVGLLGPNGAGKSTIIQIISGLLKQDDGEVSLFGLTYTKNPEDIRSKLGTVFQDRSVDLEMSIKENLNFHGKIFGLSSNERKLSIDLISKKFLLDKMLDKTVRSLSGGEQRKVEIGRALLHNPQLLIFDEATAGLDIPSRRDLVNDIKHFTKVEKKTAIWATHLVEEVENAERIIIIEHGKIVANAKPDSICRLTKSKSLALAYEKLTNFYK